MQTHSRKITLSSLTFWRLTCPSILHSSSHTKHYRLQHRNFSESSDIVNEVNRVMANPEDANGNPVALDFSKGTKTKGYSKPYSNNFDTIFKKTRASVEAKGMKPLKSEGQVQWKCR